MAKTISKDTPLSELTIRRYEKPSDLDDRELVRKLCLSIGLLQPGDSRDVVVDVLYVLIKAEKNLTSEEVTKRVIDFRKERKFALSGIAASNIRRQLKRIRGVFLIEKLANSYRITENMRLTEIFEEKIEKFLVPSILSRMKEFFVKADEVFEKNQ